MQSLQLNVNASSSALPLILIDFDQTITTQDTISPLGKFGVSYTHNPKPWSYFVDSYLEEYRQHRDHLPDLPKGDFKAFVKQLDSYQPIEKASQVRVSQHKVFEGLTRHTLTQQASTLRADYLQPGVIHTLQAYKDQVRIVSLNWSKDWIQGFLQELDVPKHHIFSNDLEFDAASGKCTGNILPAIVTAGDKQRAIDTFRQHYKTIYIGDSLGDIEALVEADVGIIIGNDPSLINALNDFGHSIEQNISQPSTLYCVNDWDQINHLLRRHQ
ncbi:HAD-like protein [Mucor ambiguus]|uniref:HAD-like protein n=1 Tax=Mucor ambiguus TaxID=91626 RepID=A0A0C9LTE9_9FUNG|nr:HAD-like protein [Mucor ambiguus]